MYPGIWLPLVTPLRAGEVDVAALAAITSPYARTGIAGIVALGTTGEAALLSDIEIRCAVSASPACISDSTSISKSAQTSRDGCLRFNRFALRDVACHFFTTFFVVVPMCEP